MTANPDAESIEARLIGSLTGTEPPANLLQELGGWFAIEAVAPRLVDSQLLTPVLAMVSRDVANSAPGSAEVQAAVSALVQAVTATEDPLQFAQSLDEFCANQRLLAFGATDLATRCLALAHPPEPATGQAVPTAAQVSRHADALETYVRLSISGRASEYKLLGVLEDVTAPQPRRYAQAVLRSIGAAHDHWNVDDRIIEVIDVLSGVKSPGSPSAPDDVTLVRNREYGAEIASDVSWTSANVELVRGFRSSTAAEASTHFGAAIEALSFARTHDERGDATVLDSALRLLRSFIDDQVEHGTAARSAAEWDLDLPEIETLADDVRRFAVAGHGLNHWSGDRKQLVFAGWERLMTDLAWLRAKLDRDSLYDAAVILDDLLQLYSASHAYDLTDYEDGVEVVRDVVRPAIASGFAARAGLMRHLLDHIDALRERVRTEDTEEHRLQLETALALEAAARDSLAAAQEPPGKGPEQAAASMPPLLAELFGRYGAAEALSGLDADVLRSLNTEIADLREAHALDQELVITDVRKAMLDALAPCADFKGEVAHGVRAVLDQLIRFVSRRMNTQESSEEYLFNADADEHDLHKDLYDWLSGGQLSGITNVEVQEVGTGRVDIQVTFPGFQLYLELKADATMVPVGEKKKYIKQTVTYQATGVRIGFLVVLRLAPPRDKGPTQHLREYVNHTTLEIPGSEDERHIVMLEIPGGRTKPSLVR
ncbi:hypothetical protein [Amycolatopsis pretoriensis]|uniref:hypothetical protein n=1 Tax=Amycolatopsis pretoriensis TaxID=218821 RepID=UPI00115FB60A|nr:hypothetical protein [Amycolatopsis pretoriensis]